MSRVVEWARLCSTCRAVRDRYVNAASGVLADPWVGVVEDVVERCGCAVRYSQRVRRVPRCEWFAACPGDAAYVARHSILGEVSVCRRCVERFDLEDVIVAVLVDSTVEPTLEEAVRRYLIEGGNGWRLVSLLEPTLEHVREGVDRYLEAWVKTGRLDCEVEACRVSMVDPAKVSYLLTFEPGLDVRVVCSTCLSTLLEHDPGAYWWRGSFVEGVRS